MDNKKEKSKYVITEIFWGACSVLAGSSIVISTLSAGYAVYTGNPSFLGVTAGMAIIAGSSLYGTIVADDILENKKPEKYYSRH